MKSNRRRRLACRQPRTGKFPGAEHPDQLILLETEVYGLVSGPAWFRVSFVRKFLDQGFQLNGLDRCVLVLPDERNPSESKGVALLEMDDVMEGGDSDHDSRLENIASQIDFGKTRLVYGDQSGALFNGRRWFQDKQFNITYNMNEYIRDRLHPVDIPKIKRQPAAQLEEQTIVENRTTEEAWCLRTTLPTGVSWSEVTHRRVLGSDGKILEDWKEVKNMTADELHRPLETPQCLTTQYALDSRVGSANSTALDDRGQTQLRAAVAGINWASRQGRPDGAAAASIVASAFPEPTVSDAKAANKAIRSLQEFQYDITLWSIPEQDRRRLRVEDSAFDTSGKEKSQHGFLIGFTTPDLALGRKAPVSIVAWKSRKLRRKASSSLLCEALSASAATSAWLWVANFEMSLRNPTHRHGDPLVNLVHEAPTVLSKRTRAAVDPPGQLVMDAKSLFDSLGSEQQNQDDARAALECSLVKEDLATLAARPRWVPHDKNPTDALTKAEGSHSIPLAKMLKTSTWQIAPEEQELAARKEVKDQLGYVPRPRQGHGRGFDATDQQFTFEVDQGTATDATSPDGELSNFFENIDS